MSRIDPDDLNHNNWAQTRAERWHSILREAEQDALGQPSAPLASLAPNARTRDQLYLLAEYIIGLVDRAGYFDYFWNLCCLDALELQNEPARDCLGIAKVYDPKTRTTTRRWPLQLPRNITAEAAGREGVRPFVHRVTADLERRLNRPAEEGGTREQA